MPDLFVPDNFSFLNQSYDWWEDGVLLIIYLLIVGLLIYSRRYLWSVLKTVPISLYLGVATLALLQYMGEHAIIFSEAFGIVTEELAEGVIYGIVLLYLWSFKMPNSDSQAQLSLQLRKTTN